MASNAWFVILHVNVSIILSTVHCLRLCLLYQAVGSVALMAACPTSQVQRLFFKHVHKLRDLALANCGSVEKRDTLRKYLNLLEPEQLKFLVTQQLRYC